MLFRSGHVEPGRAAGGGDEGVADDKGFIAHLRDTVEGTAVLEGGAGPLGPRASIRAGAVAGGKGDGEDAQEDCEQECRGMGARRERTSIRRRFIVHNSEKRRQSFY